VSATSLRTRAAGHLRPVPFGQRTLEELGPSLFEVTFVVVDTETTGVSPSSARLLEIGAVRLRGGTRLETLSVLVDPGMPIPAQITLLTGITDRMVRGASGPDEALARLDDFAAGAVLVGHHVGFDLGILNATRRHLGRPERRDRAVDTLALARRLLAGETPNFRLDTLARRFRLAHRPAHRALDDALATADLFDLLLERAGTWGVCGLEELLELPRLAGHPTASKLRLTRSLPSGPGVYLFRTRAGEVTYVGKASDLRQRVRSYFGLDDRRQVPALLRTLQAVDHVATTHPLAAAALEARLIARLRPAGNRVGLRWPDYTYLPVGVVAGDSGPRLAVLPTGRSPAGRGKSATGCPLLLGPVRRGRAATALARVIQATLDDLAPPAVTVGAPVDSPDRPPRDVATGAAIPEPVEIDRLFAILIDVAERLADEMARAAAACDYEAAARRRDQGRALGRLLGRTSRLRQLLELGTFRVEADGTVVEVDHGRLTLEGALRPTAGGGWLEGDRLHLPDGTVLSLAPPEAPGLPNAYPSPLRPWRARADGPVEPWALDEALLLAGWLAHRGGDARLLAATGAWRVPARALPSFEPRDRPEDRLWAGTVCDFA